MKQADLFHRLINGRTDLVWDYLSASPEGGLQGDDDVPLIRHCAYYGDVSAIRYLLDHGESLSALGVNFDLNGAAFHGHWQLCQFLLEQGADPNWADPDCGETALHAALSRADSHAQDQVVQVLLAASAGPNLVTQIGAATGAFMRDCRTRGETALHRAAAFASDTTIHRLLQAGADLEAKDCLGDTPLSWASWHRRPDAILRLLCYDSHRIHPQRVPMREALIGQPLNPIENP